MIVLGHLVANFIKYIEIEIISPIVKERSAIAFGFSPYSSGETRKQLPKLSYIDELCRESNWGEQLARQNTANNFLPLRSPLAALSSAQTSTSVVKIRPNGKTRVTIKLINMVQHKHKDNLLLLLHRYSKPTEANGNPNYLEDCLHKAYTYVYRRQSSQVNFLIRSPSNRLHVTAKLIHSKRQVRLTGAQKSPFPNL